MTNEMNHRLAGYIRHGKKDLIQRHSREMNHLKFDGIGNCER